MKYICFALLLILLNGCNKPVMVDKDIRFYKYNNDNSAFCIVKINGKDPKTPIIFDTFSDSYIWKQDKNNFKISIYKSNGNYLKTLEINYNQNNSIIECNYKNFANLKGQSFNIKAKKNKLFLNRLKFNSGDTIIGKIFFEGEKYIDWLADPYVKISIKGIFNNIIQQREIYEYKIRRKYFEIVDSTFVK